MSTEQPPEKVTQYPDPAGGDPKWGYISANGQKKTFNSQEEAQKALDAEKESAAAKANR